MLFAFGFQSPMSCHIKFLLHVISMLLIRDFIKDRNIRPWKSFHNEGLASNLSISTQKQYWEAFMKTLFYWSFGCLRILQYLPRRPWTNVVHHLLQQTVQGCALAKQIIPTQDNHISSWIWFLLILSSTMLPVICKILCGNKLFLTVLKTSSNKIGNGTNMNFPVLMFRLLHLWAILNDSTIRY